MNFEDIVDMEWVDSSASLGEGTEFSDLYFNQQTDFLLEQPVTPPQATIAAPEIKIEPLLNMPTTEQIKQLIEVAKQQLVLREQLQLLQQQPQQKETTTPQQFSNVGEIPTVAPSTIFAPPSDITPALPALSPSMTASSDITSIADSSIATTTTPTTTTKSTNQQSLSKNNKRRDSLASMPEESISLEAYAEADGIDLKSLTSKERRQLRNKISARNFRVRRKEYISTLEGQVNEHKQKAEELKEKLTQVENENKQLRKEMDTLKRQNQLLQQQQQYKTPSSPRISSPLPKPNLNKDISIMGTKATDSYRQQDNYILVSSAVMPNWDYKSILEKPIESPANDYMLKLAGQYILMVLKFYYNSTLLASSSSSSSMENLYDILIQSALLNNSSADKSFLWT